MVTSDATNANAAPVDVRLGVVRCAFTGAIVFGVLFVACWLTGAFSVFGASHVYMTMFTMGAAAPVVAFASGLVCSATAGLAIGALAAFTYNGLAFLESR
jgi:hypothetical protein